MTPGLVEHLLRREYPTNTRDLDAVLWRAMAESEEDTLTLPESEREATRSTPPKEGAESRDPASAEEPTLDAIRAALASAKGSVTRAAKALGLTSRYALYRLMKKHGVDGDADEEAKAERE
jgi:transcriptional regulator of acetoin/glycerol metabolism